MKYAVIALSLLFPLGVLNASSCYTSRSSSPCSQVSSPGTPSSPHGVFFEGTYSDTATSWSTDTMCGGDTALPGEYEGPPLDLEKGCLPCTFNSSSRMPVFSISEINLGGIFALEIELKSKPGMDVELPQWFQKILTSDAPWVEREQEKKQRCEELIRQIAYLQRRIQPSHVPQVRSLLPERIDILTGTDWDQPTFYSLSDEDESDE